MSTNLSYAVVVIDALRVKMTLAMNCLITTWHNLKTRFTKVAKYEANIKGNVSERFTVSSALYLATENQLSNLYKFNFNFYKHHGQRLNMSNWVAVVS